MSFYHHWMTERWQTLRGALAVIVALGVTIVSLLLSIVVVLGMK